MTQYELLVVLAGLAIASFAFYLAIAPKTRGETWEWMPWAVPTALAGAFFAWTVFAILSEGPVGLWTQVSQSAWSIQVWIDLLLAIGIALSFLVPRAKGLGMNVTMWMLFVLATGSIGVLAMMARVLYLQRAARPAIA